jgi:mycothiol synthase
MLDNPMPDNPLPLPSHSVKDRAMSSAGIVAWRPIERRDAGAWAALLAAIQAADQDWEYFSEQDLLADFDDPDRDFARGSMGIFDGAAMAGFGALTSRNEADPVHEMRYEGGVHPGYRGRGLGAGLLDWAQTAAIPLHQERYPDRPLSLSGACVSHNAGAVALYAAHGYRQARWFHAMVRSMSAPLPRIVEPAGVQVVGYAPARSEDARLIRNEAFRDHWGSTEISAESWAHVMGLAPFRPEFSFLAYASGEPLGLILGHEYDAYAAANGQRDLHIPLIGTRRAGRRRGIASALLARVLTEARDAGFAEASLGVDADSPSGAVGLYQRAGFGVEHTSITQLKPLLPAEPEPVGLPPGEPADRS